MDSKLWRNSKKLLKTLSSRKKIIWSSKQMICCIYYSYVIKIISEDSPFKLPSQTFPFLQPNNPDRQTIHF